MSPGLRRTNQTRKCDSYRSVKLLLRGAPGILDLVCKLVEYGEDDVPEDEKPAETGAESKFNETLMRMLKTPPKPHEKGTRRNDGEPQSADKRESKRRR